MSPTIAISSPALIQGASLEGARGINILLFGPPGSGKTELAKLAAAAADVSLYAAGEEQFSGREISRSERLSDLAFFQRLLAGSLDTAILFDEFEDVAWQLINRGGSKLYLNRLLETNPVPVIWTSNNIFEIDAAVLRRMSLIVELKAPPIRQRERILRRLANRYEVELDDHDVLDLARRLPATPAVLENALRAAKLSGGGRDALERAASGLIRALSGGGARPAVSVTDFDPALTCANMDLTALVKHIAASPTSPSRCACPVRPAPANPPSPAISRAGSGSRSSRSAPRICCALYRPVGEEHRRGVREAREAQAMLIFDEADLLPVRPERGGALLGGEPSQRDADLDGAHPLPFCCTTNMMERFDSASLRRFTFHILFHYLDPRRSPAPMPFSSRWPTCRRTDSVLPISPPAISPRPAAKPTCSASPRTSTASSRLIADISRQKPGSPRAVDRLRPPAQA